MTLFFKTFCVPKLLIVSLQLFLIIIPIMILVIVKFDFSRGRLSNGRHWFMLSFAFLFFLFFCALFFSHIVLTHLTFPYFELMNERIFYSEVDFFLPPRTYFIRKTKHPFCIYIIRNFWIDFQTKKINISFYCKIF